MVENFLKPLRINKKIKLERNVFYACWKKIWFKKLLSWFYDAVKLSLKLDLLIVSYTLTIFIRQKISTIKELY